jgi:hypothetical protein
MQMGQRPRKQGAVGIGQGSGPGAATVDRVDESVEQLLHRDAERNPDVVLARTPIGSPREDESHDVTVVGIHRCLTPV